VLAHGSDDGDDIFGLLALAHDDFGKSLAQRAMMVDFGEAKIFEGQVAQLG